MKALKYILYGLVILGAGALLAYQSLVEKNLESGDIVKCGLIIVGAILGMLKKPKNKIVNKKAVYQKAYAEHIQGAFDGDAKLEQLFYNAVHDYNRDKPSAAIAKLEKLRKECQRSADLRAVTVFTALCYDDMGLYEQAVKHYEAANAIRPNSSISSNMGLCYQRMGNTEMAEKNYLQAISLDSKNAFAYNNLSALYFRDGEYHDALEYAEMALNENPNMPQALGCAAICCALLGETEDYERYYRQAVANGYDGNKIKNTIRSLDPEY